MCGEGEVVGSVCVCEGVGGEVERVCVWSVVRWREKECVEALQGQLGARLTHCYSFETMYACVSRQYNTLLRISKSVQAFNCQVYSFALILLFKDLYLDIFIVIFLYND